MRICPTKAGEQSFTCKSCNATFVVRVDAEADTFMIDKKKKPTTGAAAVGAAAGAAAAKVASAIAQQPQEAKPARGAARKSVGMAKASTRESTSAA